MAPSRARSSAGVGPQRRRRSSSTVDAKPTRRELELAGELALERNERAIARHRQRSDAATLYLCAISLALACVVVAFVSGKKASA